MCVRACVYAQMDNTSYGSDIIVSTQMKNDDRLRQMAFGLLPYKASAWLHSSLMCPDGARPFVVTATFFGHMSDHVYTRYLC